VEDNVHEEIQHMTQMFLKEVCSREEVQQVEKMEMEEEHVCEELQHKA
jgi:hypothetical protein